MAEKFKQGVIYRRICNVYGEAYISKKDINKENLSYPIGAWVKHTV